MRTSNPERSDHRQTLSRLMWRGLVVLGLFFGTVGVWAATAGIEGAVVTAGQFVVDGNVKKVQHQAGGIVGQLNVREGDLIEQGAVVIRLDETIPRANFQMISKQLDELAARSARLRAERDGLDEISSPPEFADRNENTVLALIASEKSLFEARRSSRDVQRRQLQQRVTQLHDEITGLKAQQVAVDKQLVLIMKELESVLLLFKQNLVPLTRKNALEREVANLEGQKGQLIAAVAQAEGKIAETRLQMQQIDDTLREEAVKELREIEAKTSELTERRVAAEDHLRRVEIRAPASGYVHQLAVHTVGGVITPAEPAMLIVPREVDLQVEARVLPHDIDQIGIGQPARLRVLAFNQRTTPELNGTVARISADTSVDSQSGAAYYLVRIAVTQEELQRLGKHKITAGMQADVFVTTERRSPLEFLIRPLQDQFAKAFRER